MKMLTYSRMAAARLRANKRGYLSLALGIFLSIFLISSMAFGAYGAYLAQLQVGYDKVGYGDMVILDNDSFGDEEIQALDQYDRIGHAYILGQVENSSLFIGSYDETGVELMNLSPVSGRLPESAGEIALEATAMDVLETQWTLGDTVELTICAIDGETETRTYALVGILPERSIDLEVKDHDGINSFPAILVSREEPNFAVGRVGVNYLLHRKSGVSTNASFESMWKAWQNRNFTFYGLTTSGEQTSIYYGGLSLRTSLGSDLLSMLFMAGLLAGSLVVGCAVGISGAMEGLLMKRREEIGVLRALGATRRQIRRMFGRENLLLAAILAPASIAASVGAVWVASLIFPTDIKFGFHIALLLPILVFSVVVILLAGYLPLVRASKLMPMSVIRDTAMLRKGKRIKTRETFSAPRLISSRQVRLNLSRQIGASLLVGLMLVCSSMLVMLVSTYWNRTHTESEGFILREATGYDSAGLEPKTYREDPISEQSLAQLRTLDHVKSIQIDRMMAVTAVLDTVPTYASLSSNLQIGMLDEEQLEEAIARSDDTGSLSEYAMKRWSQLRKEYLQNCKTYNVDGVAYGMYLVTVDLTDKNVTYLENSLQSGKINVDAINAGDEVLIVAPEYWMFSTGQGSYTWYSSQEAALVAWNNAFCSGQTLPLIQLYDMGSGGEILRNDDTVTVGAVLSDCGIGNNWIHDDCYIVTTEQGLKNMSLRPDSIQSISVYLEGDITLEEEETLERQITAITRRAGAWSVSNEVKNYREARQEDQQQIFLFLSVTTVFFAVAVGMIVSSVTRQLQSQGRTIGMLRAVGADEKAILGCYSGTMTAGILGGFLISLMLWVAYFLLCIVQASRFGGWSIVAYYGKIAGELIGCDVVMALLCYTACHTLLRRRVREIVNRSIIENIREL